MDKKYFRLSKTEYLETLKEPCWQNASANDFGFTPVHYAAERDDILAVQDLLHGGVHVNAANISGYTALHYAACRGNLPLIQYLLTAGANPALAIVQGNFVGWTPVCFAIAYGYPHIINLLAPLSPSPLPIMQGQHELRGRYADDNYHPPRKTKPFTLTPEHRCPQCHERTLYTTGAAWDGTDWSADITYYLDCANCGAKLACGGYPGDTPELQPPELWRPWQAYEHLAGT